MSRVLFLPLSLSLSLAELLLEEVVPLEPVEEDEERDEARATEATRRRASGLPFTRVPPLRAGGDLDGPRGRDTAASEPARQTSLLPGHAQHRWTQVFQLQDRSRTGPVVTQVGTVPSTFFFFPPSFLSFSLVFFLRLRYAHETEPALSPLNERPSRCRTPCSSDNDICIFEIRLRTIFKNFKVRSRFKSKDRLCNNK